MSKEVIPERIEELSRESNTTSPRDQTVVNTSEKDQVSNILPFRCSGFTVGQCQFPLFDVHNSW